MKPLIIKIFFIVFFISILYSNQLKATEYRFEKITDRDGLPSLNVAQTYQDKSGFIWFATDEGVARFDGREYVYYNTRSKEKYIKNNHVNSIIQDDMERVWFSTENGLFRVNSDSSISSLEELSSSWVISSFKGFNGTLWFGLGDGVAKYNYEEENFKIIKLEHVGNNEFGVHSIIQYNENLIYFTTMEGVFEYNINSDKYKYIETLKNIEINQSYNFGDGYLWFATEKHGIIVYDPKIKKIVKDYNETNGLLSNHVREISKYKNNKLIISYYKDGLSFIDLTTNKINHFGKSLKSIRINGVFVDNSNVIWVSTYQGVYFSSPYKKGSFFIENKYSLNDNSARDISIIDDYPVLATSHWLVSYKNNNLNQIEPSNDISIDTGAWYINKDYLGNLWVAHDQGLTFIDKKSKKEFNYLNIENNKYNLPVGHEVYTVHPINDKQAWITGYLDFGLSLFDRDKGIIKTYMNDDTSRYRKGENFTSDAVLEKNGIWLATTDGLYYFNFNLETENHINQIGDINTRINDIEKSKTGVWVSVSGDGVYHVEKSSSSNDFIVKKITNDFEKDLDLSFVTNILEKDSILWITTKNKLIKYNLVNKEFTVFENLLSDLDFNFENSSSSTKDNFLYFGTNHGLIKISIDDLITNQYSPNVLITSIFSENKKIDFKKLKEFSYLENNIKFDFASLDFSAPTKTMFMYKLDGFDKEWSKTNNNFAYYTNLPSGNYIFKVKGSNSDSVWNESFDSYSFKINNPWWFYLIFMFVFIIIFLVIINFLSRRVQYKELEIKANSDNLTGISNRFKFNKEVTNAILNYKNSFSVIFIDLDFFKEINDSLGHDAGDEYIKHISSQLQAVVSNDGIVARIGGDEFAVIHKNEGKKSKTYSFVDNIYKTINKEYLLRNKIIKGSASIGVSFFPKDGVDTDTLLKNADIAMYYSKNNGRNKISYFDDDMNREFNEKAEIRYLLSKALIKKEFTLNYQPKVCPKTEKFIGFESLIRWNNKEKGLISPNIFIPEAENTNFIIEIGEWVIEETCRQGAEWYNSGLLIGNISLNISPVQFQSSGLEHVIKRALQKSGLPANKLEIEVTESIFINNSDYVLNIINKIKSIGVSIALDDFGTGYSSLSYLINFPIDTLKIDRAFIKNLREGSNNELVLKNIFSLAEDLGMSVVVEGVETEYQLSILSKYKFNYIQGFYYSKPITSEEATTKLISQK